MTLFKATFLFQLRRFSGKIYIIPALIFLALSLYFAQDGTAKYKKILAAKSQFIQVEKMKVDKYPSYADYGEIGFRIMYVPSGLYIFFNNSGLFSHLFIELDIGERLNLNTSLKGKELFKDKPGNFADFFGLWFLFGTLGVLVLGYGALRDRDFIKMAAAIAPGRARHFPLLFSRFPVIALYFFLVLALALITVLLNGISFTGQDYFLMAVFLLAWLVFAFFIFVLGSILGQGISKPYGFMPVFIAWLCLVYVLPIAKDKITGAAANSIMDNYQAELAKWNILEKFEKRVIQQGGPFKKDQQKTNPVLDLIESFFKTEHKDMMAVDKGIGDSMREYSGFGQKIAAACPSTFIADTAADLGSTGHENVVRFLRYGFEVKERFCDFIKEKRFYAQEEKVVSFIQKEENIFYGESVLPGTYWLALAFLAVLGAGLTVISRRLFLIALYRPAGPDLESLNQNLAQEPFRLEAGVPLAVETVGPLAKDLLYALLAGRYPAVKKAGFTAPVWVDQVDISNQQSPFSFRYIGGPGALPADVTAGTLLSFFSRLRGLDPAAKTALINSHNLGECRDKTPADMTGPEKYRLLMAIGSLRPGDVYLFYDTVNGLPAQLAGEFKNVLAGLARQGARVLYLTSDLRARIAAPGKKLIFPYPKWFDMVEYFANF